MSSKFRTINCPYCGSSSRFPWASEGSFTAYRCSSCNFLYVNPIPSEKESLNSVVSGIHSPESGGGNAIARRIPGKVRQYRSLFKITFSDVWDKKIPISWLDVGCGYGEILEAVQSLAAANSIVEGLEPMVPKAIFAKKSGLIVNNCFLDQLEKRYQFVSCIHVFSHIPDFRSFLEQLKAVLEPHGELFLETGNAADLASRNEVPSELDLPDHLTFAGLRHLIGFLTDANFEILSVSFLRRDGFRNFLKNIVKRLLGRPVALRIPYTSQHRAIRIRAKLKS